MMKYITHYASIEYFETTRLIAKKIQAEDLDSLIQLHTDSAVMAPLGGMRTQEESQQELANNITQWQKNNVGLWFFYLKKNKKWIGYGGLRHVEVADNNETALVYALMPRYWGHGYATEIAQACLEIAFVVLRLMDVVSLSIPENKAGQHVMKKVDFEFERNITYQQQPHVLHRIKNYCTVKIVPYQLEWEDFYEAEALDIQLLLRNQLRGIYHIGSTAILYMPAKPVIDILLECDSLDEIETISKKLNMLGYIYIRRHLTPHFSYFTHRQADHIDFHLHIRECGDPQIKRHVNFCDYLNAHPKDVQHYARLKKQLSQQYSDDIYSYVAGKDAFVQQIDAKAKQWAERKQHFLPPSTGLAAANWTQARLLKAVDANLNMHMTYFSQYMTQISLIRTPKYTVVNSGLIDDTFNYVLGADFSEAEAEEYINKITEMFTAKNIPFSWWIGSFDRPLNLARHLEKRGYKNTENNIAMYLNLDQWEAENLPASDLHIVRALDAKTLQDFALVLANDEASFKSYFSQLADIITDDDPIEYYVGYVNNKPVVRGLSVYYAGVVGLHWLSTIEDARKKGYGTAMQHYRLKRAKELGYHIATLQASNQGYSLYKKLGYKECGVYREYKL